MLYPNASPCQSGRDWWRCQNQSGWTCGWSGESHLWKSSHSLHWHSDKVAVKAQDHSFDKKLTAPFSVPPIIKHSSPPVEVRLAKTHHEQRHLKCCQDQKHLGEESGDDTTIYKDILDSLSQSYIFTYVNKLTPDPSPTQASDSEPMVLTLKINLEKKQRQVNTYRTKTIYLLLYLFNFIDFFCKYRLILNLTLGTHL